MLGKGTGSFKQDVLHGKPQVKHLADLAALTVCGMHEGAVLERNMSSSDSRNAHNYNDHSSS